MKQDEMSRLTAKKKEQQMLHIQEVDFKQPPRVARAILQDMQDCLSGTSDQVQPGQMRVILVAIAARHGQAMAQTAQKEVLWMVDAGQEDYEVQRVHGMAARRQQRIQRLLDEAVAQGAVASQEDLARVLQVSVRAIRRDCAYLESQGICLPTRGNLKGIGRRQTHKALIVSRWLRESHFSGDNAQVNFTHQPMLFAPKLPSLFAPRHSNSGHCPTRSGGQKSVASVASAEKRLVRLVEHG